MYASTCDGFWAESLSLRLSNQFFLLSFRSDSSFRRSNEILENVLRREREQENRALIELDFSFFFFLQLPKTKHETRKLRKGKRTIRTRMFLHNSLFPRDDMTKNQKCLFFSAAVVVNHFANPFVFFSFQVSAKTPNWKIFQQHLRSREFNTKYFGQKKL